MTLERGLSSGTTMRNSARRLGFCAYQDLTVRLELTALPVSQHILLLSSATSNNSSPSADNNPTATDNSPLFTAPCRHSTL